YRTFFRPSGGESNLNRPKNTAAKAVEEKASEPIPRLLRVKGIKAKGGIRIPESEIFVMLEVFPLQAAPQFDAGKRDQILADKIVGPFVFAKQTMPGIVQQGEQSLLKTSNCWYHHEGRNEEIQLAADQK